MENFWDERYKKEAYVYGKLPNEFFAEKLSELEPGRILLPAEGEGRNAVFAAKLGWDVFAFDSSSEGQKKAFQLAETEGVTIHYEVIDYLMHYPETDLDVISLIYAHFPPKDRKAYFQKLGQSLKKGGRLIFEGFGKKHLEYQQKNPTVGGPREEGMLFSEEEVKEAFKELDFLEFYEGEVELSEGEFHKGTGWVIRFVAQRRLDGGSVNP